MISPQLRSLIALPLLFLLSSCSTLSSLWHNPFADAESEQHTIEKKAPAAKVSFAERGDMAVLWRRDVDQRKPASPPGFSLPTIVHSDQGDLVVAGSQDGRVRFYTLSGHEAGRIALQSPCESGGLQLSNGLVVVGDVEGNIYGLDLANERIVWQQSLSSAMFGHPVAVDDDFIVQTSNNLIYRFSADGKKIWSYSSSRIGGISMHLTPSPVVYKHRIFALFSNGDVISLKADTGSLLWKRQLLISNKAAVMSELKVPVATPVVIPVGVSVAKEDLLAVSIYQGDMFFLSLRDGSTLAARGLSLKGSPLLFDGKLIVADASGAVSALDAAGITLWKKQLSNGELTAPVVWNHRIWVADEQAHVFRLSADGNLEASLALDGRIDRSPVVSKQGVLLRNNLGTLYLLR